MNDELSLVDKLLEIHRSLDSAGLPHAFGGALALAWCTLRARGTIDIDLNVFVPVDDANEVVAGLPPEVHIRDGDFELLRRDGQVRTWWGTTPLDLFLNTTEFHDGAELRCRVESFAGQLVPFLSCDDLAVFKAFFNRTKDWADLEEMQRAGTLDVDRVIGVLVRYLGADDHRVERLLALAGP